MVENTDKEENADNKITNEGNDDNESSFIKDNKLYIAGTLLKKDSFPMSKMIESIFRKAEC